MALVRSRSTHSEDLDDHTVIAPGEERNIDVAGVRAQDLLARGLLVMVDPDMVPPAPPDPILEARLLHGGGAPGSVTGEPGDYYVDDDTWVTDGSFDVYGPKGPGGWPGPFSIAEPSAALDARLDSVESSKADKVNLEVNVKDLGALGDGVANDTAAFVAAFAASANVFVPAGTYMVDCDALVRTTAGTLRGAGMGAAGSIIKARAAGNVLYRHSAQYDNVSNLRFDANNLANYGIVVHTAARTLFEKLYVTRALIDGIQFNIDFTTPAGNNNSCAMNKVVVIDNTGNGISSTNSAGSNDNAITFTSVTATLNDGNGILWRGDGFTMLGGHAEGNGGYAIQLGAAADAGSCVDALIHRVWMENNTAGGVGFVKASRCRYDKISACQAATWDATNGQLNVQTSEGNVGALGTWMVATASDGRRLSIANDRLIFDGGTDTNRIVYITPKGNGGLGIGAAGSTTPTINSGTGTPEGVIGAPIGSIYMRKDGGPGTSFYVKESGTGSAGWVAK